MSDLTKAERTKLASDITILLDLHKFNDAEKANFLFSGAFSIVHKVCSGDIEKMRKVWDKVIEDYLECEGFKEGKWKK